MKKHMNRLRERVYAYVIQFTKKLLTKTLPAKYKAFRDLFSKAKGLEALPEHKPWDHYIPLQDRKQPTFRPVYSCSEKELQALHEYLDENLAKGFIHESTLPAGYPILFVPKKNSKL